MHWEKSPSSALARPKPYQGVRVRDPVKELLRRKRCQETNCTKTVPPTADVVEHNSLPSYTGILGSDVAGNSVAESCSDGGVQCAGWKAAVAAAAAGGAPPALQATTTPWTLPEYGQQQERSQQTLAYSATADVYMQTLCPSYTMLTYTHAPLLTNFGTLPMAPAPAPIPQMELPDSGLTYLPWGQPLTTISTLPTPGVQFSHNSAPLPGSPLVHMPLSMSLTTVIPQSVDHHPQIVELHQNSEHQLDSEPQDHSLDEDDVRDTESPNLLDKLLEEQKDHVHVEDKDSYNSAIFIPNL
ncbi:POU domain class 2-associating factor 1 [Nelusetta ayraudi]|uniref:POU domain class 2-associating factor 1 n=1 Tax=Nelusetta ayraudi TaxID=303726 RepID=UPI003F7139D6